ncbi:MAG: phosphoribosylamine--glycine ligase, partial [Acidobacteria bacterium]|nr:phosphoribosylamine--glycine ligase [Acidobacteriota bacterium]
MKVLVIGSGGREHALAWKIEKSTLVDETIVAPGNPGMAAPLKTVPIKPSQFDEIVKYVKENSIDLVVIGPEAPLADGIVNRLNQEGIRSFGPEAAAARIESSKVFTRELLRELGVAQPEFEVFDKPSDAVASIENRKEFPVVIKADGLAAGKGVIIANNREEAKTAIEEIMEEKAFGDAGEKILIEDFMEGKEVSYFVLTDGKDILPLPTAQDYKRIGDGDTGPNTGGMGCYSPSAFLTEEQAKVIREKIILPTIKGLAERDAEYKGFL